MARVCAILQGTTTDYPAFVRNAERACASVTADEPGALVYECFADESTGAFVWHEVYADSDALLTHIANATEKGIADEFLQLVDLDGITVLGEVDSPELQQVLDTFNAARLAPVAAVER